MKLKNEIKGVKKNKTQGEKCYQIKTLLNLMRTRVKLCNEEEK
jgi:hypothetical protein